VITEYADLQKLSGQVVSGSYKLGADLDLNGVKWTPVSYFLGNFDGAGYTISNFTMDAAGGDIGFFAYNCGTIENLKLENVTINDQVDAAANIGLLVGYNQEGTVRNCAIINGVNGGSITLAGVADFYVGGLMGYNNGGFIINCSAMGDITVTSATKLAHAGGLVGENNGEVKSSFAEGNISITTAHNYAYAGGLTACNLNKISASYAKENIMLSMNRSEKIGLAERSA
jgi:hypothetical protein